MTKSNPYQKKTFDSMGDHMKYLKDKYGPLDDLVFNKTYALAYEWGHQYVANSPGD